MSAIGKLFGGGGVSDAASNPKITAAPPPTPRIGDAAGEGAAREQRYKIKKRKGLDDSILASGLGDAGGTIRRSTLGG